MKYDTSQLDKNMGEQDTHLGGPRLLTAVRTVSHRLLAKMTSFGLL